MVSMDLYSIEAMLYILEDEVSEPQMCYLEGANYRSDGQPLNYTISDPFDMCPYSATFTRSEISIDEFGKEASMEGPDG